MLFLMRLTSSFLWNIEEAHVVNTGLFMSQKHHSPKVYHNINYKHNVDNQFNDNDWIVQPLYVVEVHFLPLHLLVIKFQVEHGDERLEDYGVISHDA